MWVALCRKHGANLLSLVCAMALRTSPLTPQLSSKVMHLEKSSLSSSDMINTVGNTHTPHTHVIRGSKRTFCGALWLMMMFIVDVCPHP